MSINDNNNQTNQIQAIRRSISTPGTALSNWRTISGNSSNISISLLQSLKNGDSLDTIDSKYLSLHSADVTKRKSVEFARRENSVSPSNSLTRYDFYGDYRYSGGVKYEEITNVLRVSPEDLATQITLIDIPIFAAIESREFLSCGWSGSQKYQLSPNIVAFTQRFNRVSFWVVQEILSHKSVKHRAEVLSHYIKVAKRLLDLNNLHSSFAVVSALTSAPIHRLNKTWAHLSKKDKLAFERVSDLFSESDNFEKLRLHLSNAKLPCIPYLGIYLHDIVYIDIAHPSSARKENPLRKIKFNNVLRAIAEFQRSSYDHLPVMPNVQRYLSSVRYIEELQKFLEDDNYKLSLKLEPPESDSRQTVYYSKDTTNNSKTVTSVNEYISSTITPSTQSPNHLTVNYIDNPYSSQANSMPGFSRRYSNFIPGHRKARSLGTNVLASMSSMTISTSQPSIIVTPINTIQNAKNRCLIDDSVINEELSTVNCDIIKPSLPTFEIIYDDEEREEEVEAEEVTVESSDTQLKTFRESSGYVFRDKILYQGLVKRKTILKDGNKPSISGWVRYWIVLQGSHLIFFDSKHIKNCQRNDYRSNPRKVISLVEWAVALVEESDTFTLSDISGNNVYKFRAQTASEAYEWYKTISQVLAQLKCCRKSSLFECLIDFS